MNTDAKFWVPSAGSTYASDVDPLFYFILFVSFFFLALITFLMVYFSFKYKRKEGEIPKTSGVAHNTALETAWTIVPAIILFVVFVWGFKGYLKMFIMPRDTINIKVTGQKWSWSFDYPNGANTTELVIPVDKKIKLTMSSQDVIHSFFVPAFRVKHDVLPHRYSSIWFEPQQLGEYQLLCTEYCGTGHSTMLSKVRVVSEKDYQDWLDESLSQGEGMTLVDYGEILYKKRICYTCHSLDGSKVIGPSFKNAYGTMRPLADGSKVKVDDNYIRESILNPMAKVAAGFVPAMPSYQGQLKERDLDALIAFIKSQAAEK